MKVNGKEIVGINFAWDGNHRILILADEYEVKLARLYDYQIFPLSKLKRIWEISSPLRFIDSWNLTEYYVRFGEDAIFED